MQHLKIKVLQGINWTNYKLFCFKYGLAEGNFKNLKKWVEGGNIVI